ncbi:preprotein translocase subunit SecG [Candidatus Shapirobacteria bacterium]|nr:preprotein translocase subunit SecG [Candidatus Shapirobacteria bacterium]
MKLTLTIIQIILSISLCVFIFLQSKGDSENSNILSESNFQRRGWEKILFNLTVFFIFLFLLSSVIQFLI